MVLAETVVRSQGDGQLCCRLDSLGTLFARDLCKHANRPQSRQFTSRAECRVCAKHDGKRGEMTAKDNETKNRKAIEPK